MLSGKEALSRIEAAIKETRAEAARVASRLEDASRRELVLHQEERVCFADLARFRIDLAVRDDVGHALEEAGRRVETLLGLREEARQTLENEIAVSDDKQAALQKNRKTAAGELEDASAGLDEAEAAVQDGLSRDKSYGARFKQAEASQKVAEGAESKRALTQEDAKTKGAPYENDPLFSYLWKRGFGTADYRASGLIAMADRWVARLISYEGARRNYFMLLEIPKRLKDHVDTMRARADADLENLVTLEEAARAKSEVPALEAAHKSKREKLDGIDADIAQMEVEAKVLDDRRAAFINGRDEHFVRAVETVSTELANDSLVQLKRAAYRTPEPEDERIVERLRAIDDEFDDIADTKSQISDLQAAADSRVHELLELKGEFQRKRYDDYTSEFSDDDLFATLLGAFISGALSNAVYWRQLGRNHRRRARKSKPDFGSGRFRFPGPTSFPGSRGGGSSGGFRSGGGFGGGSSGGFRTGGGF